MFEIFHHKTVQAISSWIGILTALFTVMGKLTPQWFGMLTWPQSILLGIALALAASLIVAVVLAVGGWGFRLIRPLPPGMRSELPELDHQSRPIDYSEKQIAEQLETIEQLRGETDNLRVEVQRHAEILETARLQFETITKFNASTSEKTLGLIGNLTKHTETVSEAIRKELAEHKQHMSDCYSAQDEARQKGLSDLKGDLEALRRGCAGLSDEIKAVHNEMRESANAIVAQDELSALSHELERIGDELYLPLKQGDTYDREGWEGWKSAQAHWERTLNAWVDKAKWYDQGVKIGVFTVRDGEYDEETNWGVQDGQFPSADAVRQYKRHRLIRAHWQAAKDRVDRNVLTVAHGAISERECHNGQYHQ